MRRGKSLRIGVHHADAVVWGPVYQNAPDATNVFLVFITRTMAASI